MILVINRIDSDGGKLLMAIGEDKLQARYQWIVRCDGPDLYGFENIETIFTNWFGVASG